MDQDPIPQGHERYSLPPPSKLFSPSRFYAGFQNLQFLDPNKRPIPINKLNFFFNNLFVAQRAKRTNLTDQNYQTIKEVLDNKHHPSLENWQYSVTINEHLNPNPKGQKPKLKEPEIKPIPVYNQETGNQYPHDIEIKLINPETGESYIFTYSQPQGINCKGYPPEIVYSRVMIRYQKLNERQENAWLFINNQGNYQIKTPCMKKQGFFKPNDYQR